MGYSVVAFDSSGVESLGSVTQDIFRIYFMEQKCCRELGLVNMANKPLFEFTFFSCLL
jgi:hypothetical protein